MLDNKTPLEYIRLNVGADKVTRAIFASVVTSGGYQARTDEDDKGGAVGRAITGALAFCRPLREFLEANEETLRDCKGADYSGLSPRLAARDIWDLFDLFITYNKKAADPFVITGGSGSYNIELKSRMDRRLTA